MAETMMSGLLASNDWNAVNLGTSRLGKYAGLLETADQVAKSIVRPPAAWRNAAEHVGIEEKLFDSKSKAKQLTSYIAMHLSRDWRDGFFRQVDNLLDSEEWDNRDIPVTEASFRTFLRLVLFLKAEKRPGLSASANGELIATWRNGASRLAVYCRPDDQVRWVARKAVENDGAKFESTAGESFIKRLPDFLAPLGKLSEWGFSY